jgi:hypothetical protein
MAKKEAAVSERSKKSEVLAAYHDLLDELKEVNQSPSKPKQEEKKAIERSSELSCDGIITSLAETKLKISKNLESLELQLIDEYKKFSDLQKSIESSRKELEELHDITYQAETLDALVETQKRFKKETDEEINDTRDTFEQEMAAKKATWQEEKVARSKEREREEEAYSYELALKRKKDKDLYEEKKQQIEKALDEKVKQSTQALELRETQISEKEKELETLREQVTQFPEKLQEAIDKTKIETEEAVKKQYQFEMQLSQKDLEGEKRLYEQKVASFLEKIKEQDNLIKTLTARVDQSGKQVQDIAIKAVEGASALKGFSLEETNRHRKDS